MLTVTRALLADLYSHLFGEVLPERLLFGVRGAVPSSPGSLTLRPVAQQVDQYDDAIGYMADGNGRAYQGSVDPGRYFTLHPMDAAGCAHVIEGRYSFAKGAHNHEPRAWKGIDVHCWRDRNRDGVQNPSERQLFIVRASIDLHYGGRGNIVGEFSAGCQVVRQPHWDTYRDLTYHLFGAVAQYWLIDYHALDEAQSGQRSPAVTINGVPVPRTCPMWISEQLHLVAVARDFLDHLQLDGRPPEYRYQPAPPALLFASGAVVPGKLVNDRLVCEVALLLKALDAEVEIAWIAAEKRAAVTSARVRESNPEPAPVERLAEAEDETAVPDTV
jgi:hypothetical protein